MKKTLFEITSDRLKVLELLNDSEGELTEEIAGLMTINKDELSVKVNSYHQLIKIWESELHTGGEEMSRIENYIRFKIKLIDRLKTSLLQALLLYGEEDKKGIKRLEIGTLRLSTRRSHSVSIDNESEIPIHFFNEKTVRSLDKKKIAEVLKVQQDVPGASMTEKISLTIK